MIIYLCSHNTKTQRVLRTHYKIIILLRIGLLGGIPRGVI